MKLHLSVGPLSVESLTCSIPDISYALSAVVMDGGIFYRHSFLVSIIIHFMDQRSPQGRPDRGMHIIYRDYTDTL